MIFIYLSNIPLNASPKGTLNVSTSVMIPMRTVLSDSFVMSAM